MSERANCLRLSLKRKTCIDASAAKEKKDPRQYCWSVHSLVDEFDFSWL